MNFDRSLIFAYLEEDNIQRAYFRVRPLLTSEGNVQEESVSLWPNEGGLRIVPDRNEQHTFKARMRALGAYCVVDLRALPAEAGKIRTNKNFRPDKGEVNQYILYSDTVHELPGHTFYHLLDGAQDAYATLAEKAVTPLFFIRHEDNLFGPVSKSAPEQPHPAEETSAVLFEIPCPDGVTRQILYINDEPKTEASAPSVVSCEPATAEAVNTVAPLPEAQEATPAPEEDKVQTPKITEEESLPIGEKLHVIDSAQNHEETLEQLNKPVSATANLLHHTEPYHTPVQVSPQKNEPLSGTPLVKTPLHVSVPQTKNKTQEVISNQWSVGKYESPTHNLPAGAKLRNVQNPVEGACLYLREAWNASSTHDHLMDFILSLDGIQNQLETKMCAGKSGTIMQHVLQKRLQDLEAERLSALCELDKAKRDVDAYKQELLTGMASRISREIGQLEKDQQTARQQLDTLKAEANALLLQRDALLAKVEELQKSTLPEAAAKLYADAQMVMPVNGIPLRITPISGEDCPQEALIDRLMQVCIASGLNMDRNSVIAVLVLLAICPRIGIACATPAAAATLLKNIARAMGWQTSYNHQYTSEQQLLIGIRPVASTPAIFATSLPNFAPVSGTTKLTLGRTTHNLVRNAAYDTHQWPILMLPSLPFIPEQKIEGAPVSNDALVKIADKAVVSNYEMDKVLTPVLKNAAPLNGAAQKEMYRFISVCARLMDGGFPAAVDWAISLWIIPAVEHGTKACTALKAQLDEYPLSLSKL